MITLNGGTANDQPVDSRPREFGGPTPRPGEMAPHASTAGLPPLIRYEQLPPELTEALRAIVTRYELRTGAELPVSIGVTAALHGEGVTTVSLALATLVAQEMGRKVCWFDCAWLTANHRGSVRPQPSLIDLLHDHSQLQLALQSVPDQPNLVCLSPGSVPESKRNAISRSHGFDLLLKTLSNEFDHIVFDLPPVLASANGLALLNRADASLFVVRHRASTVDQVQRAIESTQPTPNLGIILNRYRPRVPRRLRRLLGM